MKIKNIEQIKEFVMEYSPEDGSPSLLSLGSDAEKVMIDLFGFVPGNFMGNEVEVASGEPNLKLGLSRLPKT